MQCTCLGMVRSLAHTGRPIIRIPPHGNGESMIPVEARGTRLRRPARPFPLRDSLLHPRLEPVLISEYGHSMSKKRREVQRPE